MTEVEMTRLAREGKNKYAREWRRKNPEKAKATAMRYWAKKALEAAAQEAEKNN